MARVTPHSPGEASWRRDGREPPPPNPPFPSNCRHRQAVRPGGGLSIQLDEILTVLSWETGLVQIHGTRDSRSRPCSEGRAPVAPSLYGKKWYDLSCSHPGCVRALAQCMERQSRFRLRDTPLFHGRADASNPLRIAAAALAGALPQRPSLPVFPDASLPRHASASPCTRGAFLFFMFIRILPLR